MRFQAAFDEMGSDTTIRSMQAFILLRQSALTNEDKKKVLSMTGGSLDIKEVEKAMRTLSTRVLLNQGEGKKKVYPTNNVDSEEAAPPPPEEPPGFHGTFMAGAYMTKKRH